MRLFELEAIIKECNAKNGILENTRGVLKKDLVELYNYNSQINKELSKLKNQIKSIGMVEDLYVKIKSELHSKNGRVAENIANRFKDNDVKSWALKSLNEYNKSRSYANFAKKSNFLHQANCLRKITKNLNTIFEKTQDRKHLTRNIYFLEKAVDFNEKLRIYDSIFFLEKLIEKYEMLEEIDKKPYHNEKYDVLRKNMKLCLKLRKNKKLYSKKMYQSLVFFNIFNVSKLTKYISKNEELDKNEKLKWHKLNFISNYVKLKICEEEKVDNYLRVYYSSRRLYKLTENQRWLKKAKGYFMKLLKYKDDYPEINDIKEIII